MSTDLKRGAAPPEELRRDPYHNAIDALEEDLQRNFTLNVGRAIETLRDDVPVMFRQEPDLSIFSDDVVLSAPSGVLSRGKNMYRTVYSSLRVARRLTFTQPLVQIHALRYLDWRSEISVRFSVTTEGPLGMDTVTFDAISVYKLNSQGLIQEHRIDDMTRNHLFDRANLVDLLVPRNIVWGRERAPMPVPF